MEYLSIPLFMLAGFLIGRWTKKPETIIKEIEPEFVWVLDDTGTCPDILKNKHQHHDMNFHQISELLRSSIKND